MLSLGRSLSLQVLTTAITYTSWLEVAVLWDRHKVTAALLAETTSAVAAVLDAKSRKSAAKFSLTLTTVVS